MFELNKAYTREEILRELKRDGSPYRNYQIFEKNYKKNQQRTVMPDSYKIIEIMEDVSMVIRPFTDFHPYDGIVFIEMTL